MRAAAAFSPVLVPLLCSVGLFIKAAGIELSGDGGAEMAQAMLYLMAFGALVLGVPLTLVGIVWNMTANDKGRS